MRSSAKAIVSLASGLLLAATLAFAQGGATEHKGHGGMMGHEGEGMDCPMMGEMTSEEMAQHHKQMTEEMAKHCQVMMGHQGETSSEGSAPEGGEAHSH
ncbi:MAG: hypothetical protein HY673_01665 [Chloroflexi bacterium]|nr:hypothetical protein [Chloroflexota bacterium]